MASLRRKLLTLALLASYGGSTVLGYGLHWLVPNHEHHHGLNVACAGDHGHVPHQQCGHQHGHRHHGGCCSHGHGTPLALAASDCCSHWHLCDICAFLAQARGERVKLTTIVFSETLVAPATWPSQRTYTSTSLGPHAPRGPPQHAA